MKLKNTFVLGKLNRDIDERLLPKGQYPYGRDIRIGNTDASDIGAIETVRGNKLVDDLGLTNGKTIGAYKDDSNRTIYWFVTSDSKDLVMEYQESSGLTTILLESSKPDGVLNFSKDFLITGINKVINDDITNDLLAWTDNYNPPRIINIERVKATTNDPLVVADWFVEEDISVIKKPPRFAPDTVLQQTLNLENYLEDKFLSYAYRYKYLDGGYSALSSFTPYQFFPKRFKLDYKTGENLGMSNVFNQVELSFNTGSKRVTDIQLVFRESNKTVVNIIETFNKLDELWGDDEIKSYTFNNSKKYAVLPSDELNRLFDNVPRLAKSQELVGNRLNYGNYLEGYDLLDLNGDKVVMDYDVNLESEDTSYNPIGYAIQSYLSLGDRIAIDFYNVPLVEGSTLSFTVVLDNEDGGFNQTFSYQLIDSYDSIDTLVLESSFVYWIESIMSSSFENNVVVTPPIDEVSTSYTPFQIQSVDFQVLSIISPTIVYQLSGGGEETYRWDFQNVATDISISVGAGNRSLKSNRSYEVGVVYMDSNGRSSTVLTDTTNTIFVPHNLSTTQNKIRMSVHNPVPEWADRYKFVLKQNKGDYETLYVNQFYEDGVYRWIKLDGVDKDKVKEGDVLVVKSDLTGVLDTLVKTKILEVSTKSSDFLEGNKDLEGNEIIEDAGLYIKIRPRDFLMDNTNALSQTFTDNDFYTPDHPSDGIIYIGDSDNFSGNESLGGYYNEVTGLYEDYEIAAGTRINIKLSGRKTLSNGEEQTISFDMPYVAQDTYANFKSWFDVEVITFPFEIEDFLDPLNPRIVRDATNNKLYMQLKVSNDTTANPPNLFGTIDIVYSQGDLIFETSALEIDDQVFYETGETFEIIDNLHNGSLQNQTSIEQNNGSLVEGRWYRLVSFQVGDDFTNVGSTNQVGDVFKATGTTPNIWTNGSSLLEPSVCLLDAFNCYVQGNGAESYKYQDAFNTDSLEMNLRPNQVDLNGYKAVRRYADITYSEPYNENSSLNGLNEFNLSRANWKDDLEKKYGSIQKLYARDTDVVVFQEDKISYVLFGKDVLYNADGSSNVSQISNVLGRQVMYTGEYGISDNPESFAFDAKTMYWSDSKRGAVLKLGGNGIFEISNTGLRTWFKDKYKKTDGLYKIGAFDPYYDQYVLSFVSKGSKNLVNNIDSTLTFDEQPKGWTSYHSFNPDYMIGLNNSFYSFDNGNLYIHHDPDISLTNKYYGETFSSKAAVMINDEPSVIKDFQALMIEGSTPWDCIITSYVSSKGDFIRSTVNISEFVKKEGLWYAYTRRNEDDNALDAKSAYGIGRVAAVNGNQITYNGGSVLLTSGDKLYSLGGSLQLVGTVGTVANNIITLVEAAPINIPSSSSFLMGRKNARIEGGNLRGYTARVDVELTPTNKEELYAINLEVAKSSG